MGCSENEKKMVPFKMFFGKFRIFHVMANSKCFYCSTKEQWKVKLLFPYYSVHNPRNTINEVTDDIKFYLLLNLQNSYLLHLTLAKVMTF